MSLILDALNRADQERTEENHTPNLHASHGPAPETPSPLRRWIIEGIIIGLALGAFAYSQFFGDKIQEPIEVTATPAPTVAPQPAPVAEKIVEPEPAPIEESEPAKTITAEPPVVQQTTPKAESSSAIASLYEQPVVEKEALIISTPPVTQIVEEVDNTQFILQQIPLITQRSSRFQRSVPSIDYAVHVYSKEEGAGFVKLNGSIRRIGAQIAPDLRLIAILNDSIVLDLKGTQFRLPALNSWVNYN